MKRFFCECGAPVGFEQQTCGQCHSPLAFDASAGRMRSPDGRRQCSNGETFGVCNWLCEPEDTHALCFSCQFNRTVPNQSLPGNQLRWRVLEQAKKRLLITLAQLGLPLVNGWQDPDRGLLFDFVEDGRSQPEHYPETFVSTGYVGGVITINALEADDLQRMAVRRAMNEPYRTVLGHLRHESGHYYWGLVQELPELLKAAGELFGDVSADYEQALAIYYQQGPAANWQQRYISAYASSHPLEDWAESWGHYLHIYDALDTAYAHEVIRTEPAALSMSDRIERWGRISGVLNELNRSSGVEDAYPFSIGAEVQKKLMFIDEVVAALRV